MQNAKQDPQSLVEDLLAFVGGVGSRLLGAMEDWDAKNQGARQKKDVLRDLLLQKLDLVTRAEFDVAFAMLSKIRATQEDLNARLAKLESAAPKTNHPRAKTPPKKTAKPQPARQKKTKTNPQKKSKNLPSLNQKPSAHPTKPTKRRIKRLK